MPPQRATRVPEPPLAPDRRDPLPTPPTIAEQLHELHEDYADRVNRLVAEDREDLVRELADGYTEEALRLIVASRR
jgi:hypothetical protein